MFEDSFVAERVERAGVGRTRWLAIGSLVVQGCVAAVVIVLPMLHPERLVARVVGPTVFVPVRHVAPQKVVARSAVAVAMTSMPQMIRVLNGPGRIPHGVPPEDPGSAPEFAMVGAIADLGMGGSGVPGVVGDGAGSGVRVVAAPAVKKAVVVSAGVTAGLLLDPIRPVYPAIARAAHVEGEVVVAARISREGRIEGLRVVRGPEMLRASAMEAIRSARYRPYLLNGVPTEVETTITVNFRMAG